MLTLPKIEAILDKHAEELAHAATAYARLEQNLNELRQQIGVDRAPGIADEKAIAAGMDRPRY